MNPNPEFIKAMMELRQIAMAFHTRAALFQKVLVKEFNGQRLTSVDLAAIETELKKLKSAIANIEQKLEVAKVWKIRP